MDSFLSDYICLSVRPRNHSVRPGSRIPYGKGLAALISKSYLHRGFGFAEFNLEQETPFKGRVQVAHQVGGRDEDPFKILQFFQDDVFALAFSVCATLERPTSLRFEIMASASFEQHDTFASFGIGPVIGEYALDDLLAFTKEHGF